MSLYALHDPRTGKCRYIGRTKHGPAARFSRHLASSHSRKITEWVAELGAIGLKPELRIIGAGVEREWIEKLNPDLNILCGSEREDAGLDEDTVAVTLRFPRELHERLTEVAEREERTFSTTVMRAIRVGLEDIPVASEAEKKGARR